MENATLSYDYKIGGIKSNFTLCHWVVHILQLYNYKSNCNKQFIFPDLNLHETMITLQYVPLNLNHTKGKKS